MSDMKKAIELIENHRKSGCFQSISDRTLKLMEDIVAADIAYDEENGICYECEAEGGAA